MCETAQFAFAAEKSIAMPFVCVFVCGRKKI